MKRNKTRVRLGSEKCKPWNLHDSAWTPPSPRPGAATPFCEKAQTEQENEEPMWSTPVPVSQGEDHTEDHGSCRRRHYGTQGRLEGNQLLCI